MSYYCTLINCNKVFKTRKAVETHLRRKHKRLIKGKKLRGFYARIN